MSALARAVLSRGEGADVCPVGDKASDTNASAFHGGQKELDNPEIRVRCPAFSRWQQVELKTLERVQLLIPLQHRDLGKVDTQTHIPTRPAISTRLMPSGMTRAE